MDWSYQLLDADEVRLFRSFAVFAGGFGIDAVEAIHGPDALPVLLRLIDKSLVVVEWRGRGQRYRMLETVREYADEKLVDSGEAAQLRDKHCDYYLALAEQGAAGVCGPDQVAWVERLEMEHDNLRAALAWCQADPDGAEREERLASALGRFWRDRGYTREAFEWLMHAAMRRPGAVSVGRGRALNWASVVAGSGDFAHERQVALLEESVSVLRQAGDPVELSLALRHLWWSRTYGPFAKPNPDVSVLEESVAIARTAGDRRDTGWGLLYLAQSAVTRGDMAEARRLTEEAVSALRGLDPNSLLQSLCILGRVALAEGEYARAVTVFTEMVDESHESGERIWLSDAWFGLAGAVAAGGDIAAARACFRALVNELRAASFGHVLPRVLLAVAMFEAGRGDQARAARWFGAFEAAGSSPNGWPLEGFCLGPGLATLRARFQQAPAAAALAAGRRLMVDQALDEALAASS